MALGSFHFGVSDYMFFTLGCIKIGAQGAEQPGYDNSTILGGMAFTWFPDEIAR